MIINFECLLSSTVIQLLELNKYTELDTWFSVVWVWGTTPKSFGVLVYRRQDVRLRDLLSRDMLLELHMFEYCNTMVKIKYVE
jgi:hypothetical protein